MHPLVSICVPVYNVAPYIDRCVHSLMQQTYDNIEYIFVDDSSTDNSIELLQAVVANYPERAAQVRLLSNDRNHGLAYTRRVSIEAAKGEYVLCVDSDDYVEQDIVQTLVEKALETGADLVSTGFYIESSDTRIETPHPCDKTSDYLQLALADILPYLWNKLIRRSLLIHFAPEGMNYLEDRIVLLYLFHNVGKIAVVNRPLYHYIQRDESISCTKNERHFQCLIQYWQLTDTFLSEHNLTDRYRILTNQQKISDKTHLMHFCNDMSICRKYAAIFSEAEVQKPQIRLTRGKRLTRFFVEHRLWFLLQVYKFLRS